MLRFVSVFLVQMVVVRHIAETTVHRSLGYAAPRVCAQFLHTPQSEHRKIFAECLSRHSPKIGREVVRAHGFRDPAGGQIGKQQRKQQQDDKHGGNQTCKAGGGGQNVVAWLDREESPAGKRGARASDNLFLLTVRRLHQLRGIPAGQREIIFSILLSGIRYGLVGINKIAILVKGVEDQKPVLILCAAELLKHRLAGLHDNLPGWPQCDPQYLL